MSISCATCGAGLAWLDRKNFKVAPCTNCERNAEARAAIALLAKGKPFKLFVQRKVSMLVIEFATKEEADSAAAKIAKAKDDDDNWISITKLYEETL